MAIDVEDRGYRWDFSRLSFGKYYDFCPFRPMEKLK